MVSQAQDLSQVSPYGRGGSRRQGGCESDVKASIPPPCSHTSLSYLTQAHSVEGKGRQGPELQPAVFSTSTPRKDPLSGFLFPSLMPKQS